MGINGNQWESMGINGNQWESMGINGVRVFDFDFFCQPKKTNRDRHYKKVLNVFFSLSVVLCVGVIKYIITTGTGIAKKNC
jgi:hypothetical protein